MHVQTHIHHSITDGQGLPAKIETLVGGTLSRFAGQISRVEVHVSDENSDKGGAADKRCVMEARIDHVPPVAVTHLAATLDQAVAGAANKLARSIEHTIGRLRER